MAIENRKEEEISFYTPTFGNSIFIVDVQEEDEISIIRLFQKIGLLYKARKVKSDDKESNDRITHYQFYSRLAYEKARNLYCSIPGTRFQFKSMPGVTYQYRPFTLSSDYNFTDQIRLLRQDQMFELCNYYFGFQNWSIEQGPIDLISMDSKKINGEIKYEMKYKAEMILIFREYPGIRIIGRGKSTSVGHDKINVMIMGMKFAITSARKDIFKKFTIHIEEQNGIREVKPVVKVPSVPNYFEQLFKDDVEEYSEELNFDEDNLNKETIEDYADILAEMDEELERGEAQDEIQGDNMSEVEKEDGVSDEVHDENGDEISLLDVSEDEIIDA